MVYAQLKQRLAAGEVVIMDGGTGTELQRRGASMDPSAWCGPATLRSEHLLAELHADYIAAGSEVITTNTFASSRLMLAPAGYGEQVEEINRRAVEAALKARDESARKKSVAVAGSLSHMIPMAEGTDLTDPSKFPDDSEAEDAFHELAQILATNGCDLIILEMMYHPKRTLLALNAALATGLPVWCGLSVRKAKDGTIASYHRPEELPFNELAALIPRHDVAVAGIMHSSAELITEALKTVRQNFDGPIMVYPDSGYFEMPDWRFVDVISPQRFEEFCQGWIASGVQILGGCCGLTVEHVRAAVRAREKVII